VVVVGLRFKRYTLYKTPMLCPVWTAEYVEINNVEKNNTNSHNERSASLPRITVVSNLPPSEDRSLARRNQSTPSHIIPLTSILILSSHVRLGLPSSLIILTLPTNFLHHHHHHHQWHYSPDRALASPYGFS
jgi:hypothetical protein